MRYMFNGVIIILFSFILISCTTTTYTRFTSKVQKQYSLTNEDIKNVQFYLSNSVKLRREVTTLDSKKIAKGHTLRTEKGKLIEEINFGNKLAGIAINVTDDKMDVSFEEGKSLAFETKGHGTVSTWAYSYELKVDKENLVLYDGADFTALYSALPYLEIIEEDLSKIEKKTRHVDGLRLKEN